ncbi:MAG: VOC family protein [Chloroflexi bacterium]|nr:VOC family protein [Chloroflexota bacterium]
MAGVAGVFHPAISVSDMDEAVRYYRDLLGLRVTFDDDHDPAAISALFGYTEPRVHAVVVSCPDGSELELVRFSQPQGRTTVDREPADAGILSVNLRVTGIEAIVERLRAGGYPPSSELVPQRLPDGGIIKVQVCQAPDGVTIILVELPEGRDRL